MTTMPRGANLDAAPERAVAGATAIEGPAMSAGLIIATEIRIDADPQQVWAVLTDFGRYTGWNPWIIKVDGPLLPGSELRLRSVHIPGTPPTDGVVLLAEACFPQMRWEGGHPDRSILKGDHVFRCEGVDSGCRFHHFERFSGLSAERLLTEYGARIAANFRRFNEALKRTVER